MKILKNITSSNIRSVEAGISIPAMSSKTLEPKYYMSIVNAILFDTDFVQYINDGDLVVNNGIVDLSVEEGKRFLLYPEPIIFKNNGTVFARYISEVNLGSGIYGTVNEQTGVVTLNATGAGDSDTWYHYETFGHDSGAADKFLNYEMYNVDSYDRPMPVEWTMKLIGFKYINKKEESKIKLQIRLNGVGSGDTVFEYGIDKKLWLYDTNLPSGDQVVFSPGDLVRCYFKKWEGGDDPDTPLVRLIFEVLDDTKGYGSG